MPSISKLLRITITISNIIILKTTEAFKNIILHQNKAVKQKFVHDDTLKKFDNHKSLLYDMKPEELGKKSSNTRRNALEKILTIVSSVVLTELPKLSLANPIQEEGYVQIPLTYKNDAYQISYRISGILFNAIVDTGSPFLMIPGGTCAPISRNKWGPGCYNDIFLSSSSSFSDIIPELYPTYEYFDGVEGDVQWRIGSFYFENATGSILVRAEDDAASGYDKRLVYGVASDSLMAGPGGIFLGLVRDTDQRIRPSFLGQTNVKAFQLDFISRPCTLTLSTKPLTTTTLKPIKNYIPLVNDLKKFGDPARHYTAKVSSIKVNGHELASGKKQPIYAIFDTGVTGMIISRELYNKRYVYATENREKSFWGFVELSFQTTTSANVVSSDNVTMFATKPVTTPLGPSSWSKSKKYKEPYVIVVGLSFLNNTILTVDIDEDKLWIQT